MIDRWAGLAHAPQMYCFLPVGVFYQCLGSIYSIIDGYSHVTRLGWVFSRFYYPRASLLLHCCIGLGNNDTIYSIHIFYILVLMNLCYFFTHVCYP